MPPRLAVAAVLALAGFIAGAVFLWPRGRELPCGARAFVSPEAAKALEAYAGRIEHDVELSSDGTREDTWADPLSGRTHTLSFDSDGKLRNAVLTTQVGGLAHSVWVSYPNGLWQIEQTSV